MAEVEPGSAVGRELEADAVAAARVVVQLGRAEFASEELGLVVVRVLVVVRLLPLRRV